MKLTCQAVAHSSVVGGGLMLLDEKGHAAFIVNFMGTTNGITKEQTAALARQFGEFIKQHGLEVP